MILTKFSLKNQQEMQKWDNYVNNNDNGSPYYLSAWLKLIQGTYNYKDFLYVNFDSSGKINGIFPCFLVNNLFSSKRLVSVPFSDFCCPLFDDKKQGKKILLEILNENKVNNFEIRGPLADEGDFICHNYYKGFVLALDSNFEQLHKTFNKRTIQYSIRKARRKGVEVREENTKKGIEDFYRLNILTRDKHGVPAQPKKFFIGFYEHLVTKGMASIFLAYYESKVVAASVFLKFRKTMVYKYNASDPDYLTMLTPNHLLTWFAIKSACAEGFKFFDFGRTAPDNVGLIRYKKMWGAVAYEMPYYYYPAIKGTSSIEENSIKFKIVIKLWKSLPGSMKRRIEPFLYKYLG